MTIITIKTKFTRRLPDPQGNAERDRQLLVVDVLDLPQTLPIHSDDDWEVVPQSRIEHSGRLTNTIGPKNAFYYSSPAIVVLAADIRKSGDDEYEVVFETPHHGIVSGGWLFRLVRDTQLSISHAKAGSDITQHVTLDVRVGTPAFWTEAVQSGINSPLEIALPLTALIEGKFNWLLDSLQGQGFIRAVAVDALDSTESAYQLSYVLRVLELFDLKSYPQGTEPLGTVNQPWRVVAKHIDNVERVQSLFGDVLVEILTLHDFVASEVVRRLPFIDGATAEDVVEDYDIKKHYPFTNENVLGRPRTEILFPVLSSMRGFLTVVNGDNLQWRTDFRHTKERVSGHLDALLAVVETGLLDVAGDVYRLGRLRLFWRAVLNEIMRLEPDLRWDES